MAAKEIVPCEPLHFKNPPIVEAVIGISVSPLPDIQLEQFVSLAEPMKERGYGSFNRIDLASFGVSVGPAAAAIASSAFHGWQTDSTDNLYRARFQRDSFLFSRLGSYDTWETFRREAREVWNLYSKVAQALNLVEFGVRYINKLYIPLDDDLSKYITCYPNVPENMPANVLESQMRLVMPIEKPEGKLIHQHLLLPTERMGFATVLLDNDFRFPVGGFSQEQLWQEIERVRAVKDDYFCKFVTKRMRDTFDGN